MSRFIFAVAAIACLAVSASPAVRADIQCFRCGSVIHTNEPMARCIVCGAPLAGPAPVVPPPNGGNAHPSGFRLGVTFVPTPLGIRVVAVQPGSAASGVLFVNDIIAAAAYRDDFGQRQVRQTMSADDLEMVKHMAGPSKTALMIRRPNGNVRYAFVTFRPVNAQVWASARAGGSRDGGADPGGDPDGQGGMVIDDTGEAASLFGEGGNAPGVPGAPDMDGNPGGGAAADFFNGP